MNPCPPVITLLSDFGTRDAYVGQMKGAILAVCPEARLIDLSHEIPPGDVNAASLIWQDAVGVFPPGTLHLGVVDPGVGSPRRGIAAELGHWRFVGPDNGLLSSVGEKWPLARAVELSDPRWWRTPVSPVFHGRDIFGPVAGHWASGRDVSEFGPPISTPLQPAGIPSPHIDGSLITGEVIAIDRFGNVRTNISSAHLSGELDHWLVEVGAITIQGLSRYFAERDTGAVLALFGSHGDLEIAVNRGNAADLLGATVGMPIRVQWNEKS